MFNRIILIIISALSVSMASCERFLDVKPQNTIFDKGLVFSDDLTATAAVTAVYGNMYSNSTTFASGGTNSVALLCALSADEMDYYPDQPNFASFEENDLLADNLNIVLLWQTAYVAIYATNSALDGLTASTTITADLKQQLTGEMYFTRAFCHFYLTNLFGKVPIITGTDYEVNARAPRSDTAAVYGQIISDLEKAITLLSPNYVTTGRVRPNKQTAEAFLARIYLYRKDWVNAEKKATLLLEDPRYQLPPLDDVFLYNSPEAIWQLMPMGYFENTNEGNTLILQSSPLYDSQPTAMSAGLASSFEAGDQRKAHWIGSIADDNTTYYFPFKYKIYDGGINSTPPVPFTEYSMVFRLAEQYLIRAEARAQQDKLADAIDDIDKIRERAGLPLIADTDPGISKTALLLLIEQERRVELFSEWGHRWFDLKRTGRAGTVLSYKTGWSANDELYPIPQDQINRNQNLKPQNTGY